MKIHWSVTGNGAKTGQRTPALLDATAGRVPGETFPSLIENPKKAGLQMAVTGNGDPRTKAELLDNIDDLDSIMDLVGGRRPNDDGTDDGNEDDHDQGD